VACALPDTACRSNSILWSLVVEWGVRPLDPRCQEFLLESIRASRNVRLLPDVDQCC
jgi:hypothetical protein